MKIKDKTNVLFIVYNLKNTIYALQGGSCSVWLFTEHPNASDSESQKEL